ncbi:MAG TPA: helix-turn-helix transcriptional regulator [Polyangium sp.]|nr:helix-turn-helix transcriptional regulator [Polyangium sp.]
MYSNNGVGEVPTRKIPDQFATRLGARIREKRLDRDISLDAMEGASGISKGHLSSIEHGKALINVLTLCKISKALALEPGELLAGLAEYL